MKKKKNTIIGVSLCSVCVGFLYWPVRWGTEPTVPRPGSSYGPGCSPPLLLQTFLLWPRVLQILQRAPARPADSPRRADCWTEAAAAYLWGADDTEINSPQTKPPGLSVTLFCSHWTWIHWGPVYAVIHSADLITVLMFSTLSNWTRFKLVQIQITAHINHDDCSCQSPNLRRQKEHREQTSLCEKQIEMSELLFDFRLRALH